MGTLGALPHSPKTLWKPPSPWGPSITQCPRYSSSTPRTPAHPPQQGCPSPILRPGAELQVQPFGTERLATSHVLLPHTTAQAGTRKQPPAAYHRTRHQHVAAVPPPTHPSCFYGPAEAILGCVAGTTGTGGCQGPPRGKPGRWGQGGGTGDTCVIPCVCPATLSPMCPPAICHPMVAAQTLIWMWDRSCRQREGTRRTPWPRSRACLAFPCPPRCWHRPPGPSEHDGPRRR